MTYDPVRDCNFSLRSCIAALNISQRDALFIFLVITLYTVNYGNVPAILHGLDSIERHVKGKKLEKMNLADE